MRSHRYGYGCPFGVMNIFELVVMAAQPCQDTKTTEMYFKMVNFVVCDLYLSKKRGRGSRNAEKGFVLTEEQQQKQDAPHLHRVMTRSSIYKHEKGEEQFCNTALSANTPRQGQAGSPHA